MKYYFEKDGNKTEIQPERWVWGVVYQDGQEFHQFDKEGKFHQVGEIDQGQAKLFVLYKTGTEKRIDLVVPKGARLIHKYRRFVFNAGQPNQTKETVYIFGYKKTYWDGLKKKDQYHFNFVMPDDNIIQSDSDALKLTEFGLAIK